MTPFFHFDETIQKAADQALVLCADHFAEIERIKEYNQQKMLKAFQQYNVSERLHTIRPPLHGRVKLHP